MPQSLSQIYIHLVFSTKRRKPFLSEKTFREEMFAYLAAVFQNKGCYLEAINGPSDHVHILFNLSRETCVAHMVMDAKKASSRWAKSKGYEGFAWQAGYGAFSVSVSALEKVRQYIANQEKHHERINFENEYLELLRKHGVNYDPKFVLD